MDDSLNPMSMNGIDLIFPYPLESQNNNLFNISVESR